MNRRFNLFKRAVETKDSNTWADYKRLRNEIHLTLEKGNLLISAISFQSDDNCGLLECIVQSNQTYSTQEDKAAKARRR